MTMCFGYQLGGTRAYAFDSRHRTYQTKKVKTFDVTQIERGG